jgi:hypothetical protein
LQVYGDNGILTVTNDTDTDVIQIRFSRAEATTVGATTTTVIEFDIPLNTVMTMKIIINGLADNNEALGAEVSTTVKNIAGTSSRIDNNDIIFDAEATLVAAVAAIEVDDATDTIRVRATGVAGRTINWAVCTPGILVNPIIDIT